MDVFTPTSPPHYRVMCLTMKDNLSPTQKQRARYRMEHFLQFSRSYLIIHDDSQTVWIILCKTFTRWYQMYMRYFKEKDFDIVNQCIYEHFNPVEDLLKKKWYVYLEEGESRCSTETKQLFGLQSEEREKFDFHQRFLSKDNRFSRICGFVDYIICTSAFCLFSNYVYHYHSQQTLHTFPAIISLFKLIPVSLHFTSCHFISHFSKPIFAVRKSKFIMSKNKRNAKTPKFIDDSASDDSPPPKKSARAKLTDDDEENDAPSAEDLAFLDDSQQQEDGNVHSVVNQARRRKALLQMESNKKKNTERQAEMDDSQEMQMGNLDRRANMMAALQEQNKKIKNGEFSGPVCPCCPSRLEDKTDEDGNMNLWCPKWCPIPFIPKKVDKVRAFAEMAKRVDEPFKRTAEKPWDCYCEKPAKLTLCKSKMFATINDKYFYTCAKKIKEGPCEFAMCVEYLGDQNEWRRPGINQMYINRNDHVARETKQNQINAASNFNYFYKQAVIPEFDWSEMDTICARNRPEAVADPLSLARNRS